MIGFLWLQQSPCSVWGQETDDVSSVLLAAAVQHLIRLHIIGVFPGCLFFFLPFLFGPLSLSISNLLYCYPLGRCCDLVSLFSGQRWSTALSTLRMFSSCTTLLTLQSWALRAGALCYSCHHPCSPKGAWGWALPSSRAGGSDGHWLTVCVSTYPGSHRIVK